MPTALIALPCTAHALEVALHAICDASGTWEQEVRVCLHKSNNAYTLELHEPAVWPYYNTKGEKE